MNSGMYKIINLLSVFTMILAIICFISSQGSGFIDLSNIGRYFFAGMTIISGIIALSTLKKAWEVYE